MAISTKIYFWVLHTLLALHLASSFSVEELCAKRCLYGRGGVLCNCNVMHFTGKRSDASVGYNKAMNSRHREYVSTSPIYAPGKEISRISENNVYDDYLNHGESKLNELPEGSWKQKLHRDLSSDDETDLHTVHYAARNEKARTNKNYELPVVYIEDSEIGNRDEADDDGDDYDDVLQRRREAATKVKEIMNAGLAAGAPREALGNLDKDLTHNDQADVFQNGVSSRQHLTRLQNVLRQALQGR